MLQQTSWLSSALPALAPVYVAAEAQPCKWVCCIALLPPSEIKSAGQLFPLHRVLGMQGKWVSEVEQDSRTKALILSKLLSFHFAGGKENSSEKGHTSVWKARVPKDKRKFLSACVGGAIEPDSFGEFVYFSVLPAWSEEAFEAILAPPKSKPARKPSAKKAKSAPAPEAEGQPAPQSASGAAQEPVSEAAPAPADNPAPAA